MLRVIIIVTINGTPQVLMDGVMTKQQIEACTALVKSKLVWYWGLPDKTNAFEILYYIWGIP